MDMDNLEGYHIELAKVVKDKKMMSVTRLLAAELMDTPYKTVGQFFQDLSDTDLETILDIVETNGEGERYGELLLITHMLNGAEGFTQFDNLDRITERVNQFAVYTVVTSLHRKGLVKVHFENMSFGEDMKEKVLVEKIEL